MKFYQFYITLLVFTFVIFNSCQKIQSTNPFDAACPKSLFSPQGFTSIEYFKGIKLSWTIANSNISGFKIKKYDTNNQLITTYTISKTEKDFYDSAVSVGNRYSYSISAYASNNYSNELSTSLTINTKLTTLLPQSISSNSTIVGGAIVSNPTITINFVAVRLFENNLSGPTITSSQVFTSPNYTFNMTALKPNTIYICQAFLRYNNTTYAYGNEITFRTQ